MSLAGPEMIFVAVRATAQQQWVEDSMPMFNEILVINFLIPTRGRVKIMRFIFAPLLFSNVFSTHDTLERYVPLIDVFD